MCSRFTAPDTRPSENTPRVAAVAMVLRHGPDGALETLFMKRAERADDPWSGRWPFPAGTWTPATTARKRGAPRNPGGGRAGPRPRDASRAPQRHLGRTPPHLRARCLPHGLFPPRPRTAGYNYEVAGRYGCPSRFSPCHKHRRLLMPARSSSGHSPVLTTAPTPSGASPTAFSPSSWACSMSPCRRSGRSRMWSSRPPCYTQRRWRRIQTSCFAR